MKQALYKKYLFAFMVIFIVPLIILSFFLQYILYTNLEKDVISYNNNIVERLGDDFKNVNGRLMEMSTSINFDNAVLSDLTKKENQLTVIQLLMEKAVNNPYVSKVYLLHRQGDIGISSSGIYQVDDLLTKQLRISRDSQEDFLTEVSSTQAPRYLSIKKEYVTSEKTFFRSHILFIYPQVDYRGQMNSWVIIEVNNLKLNDMMLTSPGTYNKGIVVLNKEMEILSNSVDIDLTEQLREKILGEVRDGSRGHIYFEHEHVIISIMEKMDIVLVSYIEPPNLIGSIVSENRVLVILVLLLLIVGTFLSIYMAYRYYRPIHQLSKYMNHDCDVEIGDDDLQFIRKRYDQVESTRLQLADELDRQWPLVEERLVTKLLYYTDDLNESEDLVQEFLSDQLKGKEFCAFAFKKNNDMNQDIEKTKRLISDMRIPEMKEYLIYQTYLHYIDTYVVILGEEEIEEADKGEIRNQLERIVQIQESEDAVIAEGTVHYDITGIRLSFLEAIAALNQNLDELMGTNLLEGERKADEESVLDMTIFQTEGILDIKRCISTGSTEGLETVLEEISLNLEGYPRHMYEIACYDIVNQVIKEVENTSFSIGQEDVRGLLNFKTLDDFIIELLSLLTTICDKINQSMDATRSTLINEVNQYIDENFSDQELSLQSISEAFNYSPSYMSKFITQYLGDSFTNILTVKRIEYTKRCLVETETQINQIAKEAGYNNTSNFMRRFKKIEGVTPGQYRNIHKS